MKKLYFGKSLDRPDLADAAFLSAVAFPRLVSAGLSNGSDADRQTFVAFAAEIHRTWNDTDTGGRRKMRNPAAVFVRALESGDWRNRDIPETDDETARRRLAALNRPEPTTQTPTGGSRDDDHDEWNAAAEVRAQVAALARRKSLAGV